MDMKDMRAKNLAGLDKELQELRKAHFSLRMQKATQQLQNTRQIRTARRDIARVHTLKSAKLAEEASKT